MRASTRSSPTFDVTTLRGSIRGRVAVPGESIYDDLRSSWNLAIDHLPEVAVEAACVEDVREAVRWASSHRLSLTVQTTGHGQPRACRSGVLLLMGRLNSVEIDRAEGSARIGGGAVWGDVVGPAFENGLAPISGSSPGVGVVGYLVGGGFGLMSRKHGLAIDTLRSAKVVLADGSLVETSARENSELFWAIRGGGGAFGVVVEVEVGLVPHPHVFGGNVMFDSRHARTVLEAWAAWTKTVADEVSSALCLVTFPPVPFVPDFLQGRSMVVFAACVASAQKDAEKALDPIRSLPGAEFDSFRWMPYTESASVFNDPVDPLPAMGNGVLLREFDGPGIETFLDAVGPLPESPNLMVQVRHLGGAIGRLSPEESAMGDRRKAQYLLYWLGVPMGPHSPEQIAAHACHGIAAMRPWSLGGAPLNWVGEGDVPPQTIESVYDPATLDRLIGLKRAIDPANLFSSAGVGICVAESAR